MAMYLLILASLGILNERYCIDEKEPFSDLNLC
jgi:hypothetical protein